MSAQNTNRDPIQGVKLTQTSIGDHCSPRLVATVAERRFCAAHPTTSSLKYKVPIKHSALQTYTPIHAYARKLRQLYSNEVLCWYANPRQNSYKSGR